MAATDQRQSADQLLMLMTGAWRTQAIAVAADLQLADYLADAMSTMELANRVGADHDSLLRLLRYLASMGVVRTVVDGFELTELGQLLRSDVAHSMRSLASLYGGPFYKSFAELKRAVRTGQDSFAYVFGKHHFDYFAENPEFKFDEAMAASATTFGTVTQIVDFTRARLVIDVGGGSGELLRCILEAVPHLRGVLFERSHVLAAGKANLADYLDRCDLVAGDFTSGVPVDGDVYLLSRVLHDWDDQQCIEILRRCSESMPPEAELLIIERLLPDNHFPSLSVAWDVHMLCNVGGRERTADHYQELLDDAGLVVQDVHQLPLEFALLRVAKSPHV
ncbi:methyltransferase [Mycobacteroides abscessus]|uniref:methyltransferase n=1 Tax=Mycobacteroides abscessus TaxID=36809 RepID=UPI000C261323|nr:methyltransferase [Mycobacteroides abscessus]